MKAILFVFALLFVNAVVAERIKPLAATEYQFLFKNWMSQHNKVYHSTSEFDTRYTIWKSNLDHIRQHMSNEDRTHDMAMNQFGDLTHAEFKELYLGLVPRQRDYMRSLNTFEFDSNLNLSLPDSVDWEASGKVTDVKDQGQCGSCWAFSTTGSTESAYAIENNVAPISLSEQELVDCSQAQGNQGCSGGLMDQGFEFIIANGGLCTENDYPYTAVDDTCTKTKCKSAVTITAFTDVPANNEDALQAAAAQQPISVAVDAESWQFYSGGVYSSSCGTSLDHGVLLVGYGTADGKAFWKVKNSWGPTWGEKGYIRLSRGTGSGKPGQCGIAMDASYPTGAHLVKASHRVRLH